MIFRVILLLVTLSISLALVEALVSLVRPDLAELARNDEMRHTYRIHANPRNQLRKKTHPDTGKEHLVIRNSLGFRQHREFSQKKEPGTIRVGFFGDSFTENRRLPVAYSFTEPLQHLFDEAGKKVEILNFGTDGYGTDQAYLQYVQEGASLDLDYVIYIFCGNDLVDNLANNLYSLNDNGDLLYRPVKKRNLFKSFFSRFATTYLAIQGTNAAKSLTEPDDGDPSSFWSSSDYEDGTILNPQQEYDHRKEIWGSWGSQQGKKQSHEDRSFEMLEAIVERFHRKVTECGKYFSVFFLPKGIFKNRVIARFKDLGIPILETEPLYKADLDDVDTAFFKTDPHWNEEGNKLAAVYLFQYLLSEMGEDHPGDAFVSEKLGNYYDVFGRDPVGPAHLAPPASPTNDETIRNRFLDLERNGANPGRRPD